MLNPGPEEAQMDSVASVDTRRLVERLIASPELRDAWDSYGQKVGADLGATAIDGTQVE